MRPLRARTRPVVAGASRATAGRRLLATALALGVLTGLASATAPPAQADPTGCADPVGLDIQNGGFEDPAVPPLTGRPVTQLPGWTVSGFVVLSGPTRTFASGSQDASLGRRSAEGSVSQVLDGTSLAGTSVTVHVTSLYSGMVSLGGRSQPVAGSPFDQQTHTLTFDVPAGAPADLELTLASDYSGTGSPWIVDVVSGSYVACSQAPVAVDDTASTPDGTAVTVPVLANDTDPDGDPLTVASVSTPGNGTAVADADGTVTYTPTPRYVGTDTFTYTATDGTTTSEPATVTITVTAATCDTTPPPGSIVGTGGNNVLGGTAGNDLIYALGGNDAVNGRGGDDLICGGPGNDALAGGDGNDRISGAIGNDAASGGAGDDTLSGGDGDDALDGGAGSNTVDGGPGRDACRNPTTGPGCPEPR